MKRDMIGDKGIEKRQAMFQDPKYNARRLDNRQQPRSIPGPFTNPPPGGSQERDSREDQARLAALYHVTRVLGTSLELDEVLAQVMDSVIGLTGAERGILVLIENNIPEWTLRVARNLDQDRLSSWEKEVSRTIINMAINTGKGVVTSDAQSDPRFSTQASVRLNILRSMMCTPLLVRGRVIGAIYVDSRVQRGVFNAKDLEMMDAFAIQAAFAIDNARIFKQTVQQLQQLTIELDEAKRARQVAEITQTEYFQQIKAMAQEMRKRSSQP